MANNVLTQGGYTAILVSIAALRTAREACLASSSSSPPNDVTGPRFFLPFLAMEKFIAYPFLDLSGTKLATNETQSSPEPSWVRHPCAAELESTKCIPTYATSVDQGDAPLFLMPSPGANAAPNQTWPGADLMWAFRSRKRSKRSRNTHWRWSGSCSCPQF